MCCHRVGHNEIIGVMRVGCHAEGLGRDHWNEMLAYPRKPVAHWHPLLEAKKSEKEVSVWAPGPPQLMYLLLNLLLGSVSCSGRLGQPALTARAPALHPGPPPAPEQHRLRPSSSVGGPRPPDDPLPVCPTEEKHSPAAPLPVSPCLSLSSPSPRALQSNRSQTVR